MEATKIALIYLIVAASFYLSTAKPKCNWGTAFGGQCRREVRDKTILFLDMKTFRECIGHC